MPHYPPEHHISTLLEALNPVRDAAQNWGIDVAQYLEAYLEQLASESGANFREAALLIENSTVIYVKKVDYLWVITHQLVDNLHKQKYLDDKKKDSQPEIDERTANGENSENTRKKKKHKELDKTKYSEINIEISDKLLELEPSKENRQPWKFLPDVYHQFQKRPLSNKKKVVYGCNGEEEEVRHFKCNSVLLPSMTLHHEFKDESAAAYTSRASQPKQSDYTADLTEQVDHAEEADFTRLSEEVEENHDLPIEEILEEPDCSDALSACVSDLHETDKIEDGIIEKEPSLLDGLKALADQERALKKSGKSKKKEEKPQKKWDIPKFSMYVLEKDEDAFLNFRGFEDYEPGDDADFEGFRGFPHMDARKKPGRKSKRVLQLQADTECSSSPLPSAEDIREAILAEDNDSYAALETLADASQENSSAEPAENSSGDAAHALSQLEIAKRVNLWHQSIRPKLALAEKRGHFDIHDYGSKILETFPQSSAKTTMTFHDVVKDIDTADVARYFLSTLQLANTSNVKLSNPGGPLSMDQLELTLLSSARHHEELEEYLAPSQEEAAEGPFNSSVHFTTSRKRK